jgi:hypothetical protein
MKHFTKAGANSAKVQKLITAPVTKTGPGTALLAAIARTRNPNTPHQPKGKTA